MEELFAFGKTVYFLNNTQSSLQKRRFDIIESPFRTVFLPVFLTKQSKNKATAIFKIIKKSAENRDKIQCKI